MTRLKTILLLLFITCSPLTLAFDASDTRVKDMVLSSAIATQQLKFTVILPEGYDPKDKQRYPVFYTQTDSRRMKLIAQQIDWLSHLDFGPIPQMIIVTLPYVELPQENQHKDAVASGMATPLTISVLKKELLPYIDNHFKTQPFRIIEGYSTQANLPLGILATQPQLFNAYISISPALELDKSGLLNALEHNLPKHNVRYRSVFASLGSFTNNKPLFDQLSKTLAKAQPALNSQLVDFSHINYYTTPVTALPQALEALFKDRSPQDIQKFSQQGYSAVLQYFKQLKNKYGYMMSPVTTLVDLAQYQLAQGSNHQAMQTLTHVVKLKPDSIYYLTLLASAQQKTQQKTAAKQSLDTALQLAIKTKNPGEIDYVKSQIDALNH